MESSKVPSKASSATPTPGRKDSSTRLASNDILKNVKQQLAQLKADQYKTMSIQRSKVKIQSEVLKRLEKLYPIFDFGVFYKNVQVAELSSGKEFGEMALRTNEKRNASIVARVVSFLAYLDKNDYQKVMTQVTKRDMNKRMEVLRQNSFFNPITTNKLFQMSYYIKKIKATKN